jgi:hypothetical protein
MVVVGACGSAREASRVGMERDQSSVIFGFTPAKVGSSGAAPRQAALGGVPAPVSTPFPQPTFSAIFQRSSASSGPCPSAEPDAPVSSRAPTEISGRPKPGTYRWLGSGTYTIAGSKAPIGSYFPKYVTSSQTFTDNVPRNNGAPAGDNFRFSTLEDRPTGLYWRLDWQVKTDPGVAQDPEGGLVLKSVEIANPDGSTRSTYFSTSGPGLLMAPFPIDPGQRWNSATIDFANGRSLNLQGQMLDRAVIDACGTLVEGWHVHASLSDTGSEGTLDYLIGTEYGGQIIAFSVDGFWLGTQYDAKTRIGQIDPGPLPKGLH